MKLYIKNMVCNRCKMAVDAAIADAGYHINSLELGEINIKEDLNRQKIEELNSRLRHLGFDIIDDRKSRVVEKIKNIIIQLVHHSEGHLSVNLSSLLVDQLHYDYNYLSNLFSEVEGSTVEKYFINQKIEKVKELLTYDELTLSEIVYKMGYSSSAYLSSQFKKVTGLTPGHFKKIKEQKRLNIEDL